MVLFFYLLPNTRQANKASIAQDEIDNMDADFHRRTDIAQDQISNMNAEFRKRTAHRTDKTVHLTGGQHWEYLSSAEDTVAPHQNGPKGRGLFRQGWNDTQKPMQVNWQHGAALWYKFLSLTGRGCTRPCTLLLLLAPAVLLQRHSRGSSRCAFSKRNKQ